MNKVIARRSFRGQADPDAIEEIHAQIEDLWSDATFVPDLDRMTFATAVIEAATNIVRHAVPVSPCSVEISVEISVRQHTLRAEISAYGATDPELDIEAHGMPGPEAESGRGLALIRALVTSFTFARQDGTNVWILSRDATTI